MQPRSTLMRVSRNRQPPFREPEELCAQNPAQFHLGVTRSLSAPGSLDGRQNASRDPRKSLPAFGSFSSPVFRLDCLVRQLITVTRAAHVITFDSAHVAMVPR